MNWNDHEVDRVAIRPHIRAQLRARGLMEFCDDDAEYSRPVDRSYVRATKLWLLKAQSYKQLKLEPVLASSTDHPQQAMGKCAHTHMVTELQRVACANGIRLHEGRRMFQKSA